MTGPRSTTRAPARAGGRAVNRPPGGSGAGRALRAVAALAVLLALCAGIPLALLALTSTSFPHGVPGPGVLLHGLAGPDDGSLFLAVLTLAAWAGWATFAVAVLLEIPAQLRGVPTVRVRGLGVQQSVAGGLVAAVLAIVLVPGAASASERTSGAHGHAHAPAASARLRVQLPAPPSAPGAGDHRATGGAHQAAPGAEEYVVRRGDTLWDVAAAHLGDGAAWRRIAALNYDRVQPDGAHLDRSHVLRPGWRLALPAGSVPVATTTGAHGGEHVVRAGDTLSGIAREELGDGSRYPELVRATEGVRQPDGRHLEDPDLIYPGWRIEVPAASAAGLPSTAVPPAATAAPSAHVPAPPEAHPSPAPPDGAPAADETLDPSWGPMPTAGMGRASAPAVPVIPALTADPAVHADDGVLEEVLDVRTVAGTGALLAACLLLLLSARRGRQQRRRRPGERLPLAPGAALGTEARLRAVADPAGVEHVDLALRALAGQHRAAGLPLPQLRSARLTASHLELHLVEAARLPAPWTATSDPTIWAMTREELVAQPETDMRAPYPTLVTLGHDTDGASLLVDLEHLTALALDGDREQTLPLLAAMAVELGTSPWADDLLVTLVGGLPELPGTVASGRLRHVERVEQLIADLEGRARDVERVLRDAGVDDVAAARGAGVADDAWSPEIVLLAGDVPADLAGRLEEVLYRVPRVGLAAVTGGGRALGDWRLTFRGRDARLDPLGVTLQPQRLSGQEYADVLDLLRTADADPVPGPGWAAALPGGEPALDVLPTPVDLPAIVVPTDDVAPDPGPLPVPESPGVGDEAGVLRLPRRAPYVRLLGRVEVLHAGGPEPVSLKDGKAVASHLGRATALVAFLASRPDGATVDQVAEGLSPVRRLSPSTIWSLASRTRKWLGSDPDGDPYFPRTADSGVNRLHPAVRTDWQDWLDLVGPDAATTPTPHLVQALTLVRGRPFEGVQERHFAWAEPLRQEMLAAVVDVAHEVARRALAVPDVALARRAAAAGRMVDATNELLWRDAMRAEYVAGNREGQRRLVEQIYGLADDLETDLEPETEQLIAELDRWGGARVAR